MRLLAVVLSVCLMSACATPQYRFAVWPDPDELPPWATPEEVEAADILDHPCGWVREIETARLPPPGAVGHVDGTEAAVEFDADGRILRRWSLPVDAFPLAIDGTRLEFGYGRRVFVVDAEGRVRERSYRDHPGEAIACPPAIQKEYHDSEFLICMRMPDLGSGVSRNLAFEGVCT